MKTQFLIFFISIATSAATQNEIFGIATYTAPAGWKKEAKGNVVTYTIADNKSKTWCVIGIYDSIESKGSSEEDFNSEWQQLVASKYNGVETLQSATPVEMDGWYVKKGSSKFLFNKKSAVVTLNTISGYKKCVSITALSNSSNYEAAIHSFLSSVKLSKPGTALSKKNKTVQALVPDTNFIKADIWMNMQINPAATNIFSNIYSNSVNPKFYVVYSNGDYYPELPTEGLRAISNTNKQNDSWGKFTMNGNIGSFRSKYENLPVEKISATQLKKTGYSYGFFKCAPVDGLKIEGGWSSIPNWTNDAYYSQSGCRQVIYFKKDGSFDDRGLFVSNCNTPNKNPQDAPGKGSYSISNYTITLKYSDGRLVYKAFTGVANKNPATENEVVYIGTNPVYKK